MSLKESEAYVLRTYKLAEADKIVVCLTRTAGVVRGVAKGARRLQSRFGAALEPATHVTLSYFEKEASELVSIRQADILHSYFHLSTHVATAAAADYFAELVLEFAPPQEPNERLFRMLGACLDTLAEQPAQPAWATAVTRYFEIWLLRLSGFLPDIKACTNCRQTFATMQGALYAGAEQGLRCAVCAAGQGLIFSVPAYQQLSAAASLGPQAWARTWQGATTGAQQEVTQLLELLLRRVLEREPRGRVMTITNSKVTV